MQDACCFNLFQLEYLLEEAKLFQSGVVFHATGLRAAELGSTNHGQRRAEFHAKGTEKTHRCQNTTMIQRVIS